MVPTSEPLAWDWMQNTNDGVNSTVHGFAGEKLPLAKTWMNWITGVNTKKTVPVHKGLSTFASPSAQLENMALVLYGGFGSSDLTKQFYIPVCPSPGKVSKNTCKGATWQWAVNTNNQLSGVLYVSNKMTDAWYDSTKEPGVRGLLQ
jgi:hypothetical protein